MFNKYETLYLLDINVKIWVRRDVSRKCKNSSGKVYAKCVDW